MKYKTCVTIAKPSPYKLQQALRAALEKSDYAEARLDHIRNHEIPAALEAIKPDIGRIVCTLRPKTEGGGFSSSEKERIAIIKLIAEYNPCLLDIEYNTIRNNPGLSKFLRSTRTKILVSWHDFEKTPTLPFLKKRLQDMGRFSSHVKMVCTARNVDDSTRMLQLYKNRGRTSLISFAMGDHGRTSRILCLYLGSPYTYVSAGRPAAPGQFSIDQMQRIINLRV